MREPASSQAGDWPDDPDRHPFLHILERDGFTCQLCGCRRNLEVHHIRARSKGGDDSESNLLTLCVHCHVAVHSGRIHLGQRTSGPRPRHHF